MSSSSEYQGRGGGPIWLHSSCLPNLLAGLGCWIWFYNLKMLGMHERERCLLTGRRTSALSPGSSQVTASLMFSLQTGFPRPPSSLRVPLLTLCSICSSAAWLPRPSTLPLPWFLADLFPVQPSLSSAETDLITVMLFLFSQVYTCNV